MIVHLAQLHLALRQTRSDNVLPRLDDVMIDGVYELDAISVTLREIQSNMTDAATSIKNLRSRRKVQRLGQPVFHTSQRAADGEGPVRIVVIIAGMTSSAE